MKQVLQFLIFPGFIFTAVVGLLASGIDRIVTARLQYRIGPPVHQPFIDIVKLLGKETLIPRGAIRPVFLTSPLIGLAAATLVSTLLCASNMDTSATFIGDIIVALYLLTIPSLGLILSGFASGNPLASLGASREMKMILSYEFPFLLAIVVPVIKSGGTLTVGGILDYQASAGAIIMSASGGLAFLAAVLCMQAKLGLVPFDIPEAETEIIGGPAIEYSGPPLAVFKLTKAMLLFVVPMFLMVFFMGGFGILKYAALLVLTILLRNTNPRLRIDQALRFFWGPVTVLAAVSVVLALLGF